MRVPKRSLMIVPMLAALTLAASGCAGARADLGPGANPATGEPIRVGYINQEQAASGSFPELRNGTEAAAAYLNADGGGVNGRPIELVECIVDGSPESSQQCANEMVQEKVVAVLSGIDYSGPTTYEVVHAAGIPYIPTQPIRGTDYTGDGVFAFLGASAGQLGGEAKYLAEQGVRSVSLIVNDTPAGLEGANILTAELAKHGITDVTKVPESPTATDFTAAVTVATKNKPDAVAVVYVAPACGQIMQTAHSLGVEAKMMFTTGCLTPTVLASAGDAAEGAYFMQELLPTLLHQDDAEVKIYTEAMAKYKDKELEELSSHNAAGFSVAMTVFNAIAHAGEPTAQSVMGALGAPGKGFMDSEYTCDGTALPGFPTICNSSVRVVTIKDGRQVEATTDWVSPS